MQALPLHYVPCHLQAQTLEFTVNQAKPLRYIKEPWHLLLVTFLKQELQPVNFAIITDTDSFPPQKLRRDIEPSSPWYRRVAKKATESLKMSSLRFWVHFPDTWIWLVYFQRRLQKIRLLSRQMGMAEVLQKNPGWDVSDAKYLLWCLLSCSQLFHSDHDCISAKNDLQPDIQLRQIVLCLNYLFKA